MTRNVLTCSEGTITESVTYNPDGSVLNHLQSKYTANTAEDLLYTGRGALIQREEKILRDGLVIESRLYQSSSTVSVKSVPVSSEKNRQVWESHSSDSKWKSKTTLEQNAEGGRQETIVYGGRGAVERTTIYTYSYDGRHVQTTEYDGSGTVISMEAIESEIDPELNWSKSLKKRWNPLTKSLEPFSVEYSTYSYY